MGEGTVRKKHFCAKRSLRKGDSWKVTCDADVVFIHASKPRGQVKKISTPLEGNLKRIFVA